MDLLTQLANMNQWKLSWFVGTVHPLWTVFFFLAWSLYFSCCWRFVSLFIILYMYHFVKTCMNYKFLLIRQFLFFGSSKQFVTSNIALKNVSSYIPFPSLLLIDCCWLTSISLYFGASKFVRPAPFFIICCVAQKIYFCTVHCRFRKFLLNLRNLSKTIIQTEFLPYLCPIVEDFQVLRFVHVSRYVCHLFLLQFLLYLCGAVTSIKILCNS